MIDSRQPYQDYGEVSQALKVEGNALESYMVILEDLRNVIEHINNSAIQFGIGSPEGVIIANNSQLYYDTAATTMYINSTIGLDTGWTGV